MTRQKLSGYFAWGVIAVSTLTCVGLGMIAFSQMDTYFIYSAQTKTAMPAMTMTLTPPYTATVSPTYTAAPTETQTHYQRILTIGILKPLGLDEDAPLAGLAWSLYKHYNDTGEIRTYRIQPICLFRKDFILY